MKKKDSTYPIPDVLEQALSDSSRYNADQGVQLIEVRRELFEVLYNISFNTPYPKCMRAARILQLYCEKHPRAFDPYLQEISERIKDSKIGGVKRSYLKIICQFSGIDKINDPGILIDIAFKWLSSPAEDLSVRYYCLEIIKKMLQIEPLLKNEFIATLESIIQNDRTSLKFHAQKTHYSLKKNF